MDTYERIVQQLFAKRFNLTLHKIKEHSEPTPDFEVHSSAGCVAVLEVKAIECTAVDVSDLIATERDFVCGSLAKDNCASRVATKIHTAIRQLEVSSHPKILVLVNDGIEADQFDLQEALRGYLSFGDEKVTMLPVRAWERMIVDRGKVDLYVWIEQHTQQQIHWVATGATGRQLRQLHFSETALDATQLLP